MPKEKCRAHPDNSFPSTLHWLEGGNWGAPSPSLWEPPWLQALCLPGCGAPDLPSTGEHRGEGEAWGTGNEINSLSKLLITGGKDPAAPTGLLHLHTRHYG